MPLFTYTVDKTARALAVEEKPSWRYPCGLCNAGVVTEPGALCAACAPVAEPPSNQAKRRAKKTTAEKTSKSTSARKRGES
ncbi:MAG: hypothetical protein ACRDQA_03925 [Nocardioidaceae bacterium]